MPPADSHTSVRTRLPGFYSHITICRWVDKGGSGRYSCGKAMTSTVPRVPGRPASLRLVQGRHENPHAAIRSEPPPERAYPPAPSLKGRGVWEGRSRCGREPPGIAAPV